MQRHSFSHGLWLPLYIITGGYFHPLQVFSGNAAYLEQIQREFTFTSLLIFTVKWYSFPYASPCPHILLLNGSHSGLLAGEGSSVARRLSTSSSPESFLDETSLAEHLMALAGIQCGCSWVVALVPKSRGSALRNVDSLEDAPIFSYSKDMAPCLVTRGPLPLILGQPLIQEIHRERWAQKPRLTPGLRWRCCEVVICRDFSQWQSLANSIGKFLHSERLWRSRIQTHLSFQQPEATCLFMPHQAENTCNKQELQSKDERHQKISAIW